MQEQTPNQTLLNAIKWPIVLLIIMWSSKILENIGGLHLSMWGIWPRHAEGLWGILTGPLVHGSMGHLINNSVPFFVTGLIIFYFYQRIAFASLAIIWIFTGFLVWIFGKPAFHIGASGVVYGMVSFIFWTGFFNRERKSIVLALVILFLYSGMFYGVLPNQPGVSWESHLLGGIVGIFTAYLFKSPKPIEDDWIEEEPQNYFDSNTFKYTKDQRSWKNPWD